jgi:hypothetical protein
MEAKKAGLIVMKIRMVVTRVQGERGCGEEEEVLINGWSIKLGREYVWCTTTQ